MPLHGSHWALAAMQPWMLNALFALVILGVPGFTSLFAKGVTPFNVNVSFSAQIGDPLCLMTIVYIGWTVINRGVDGVPDWGLGLPFHLMMAGSCLIVAVSFTLASFSWRHGHLLDRYHDLVTAPLFAYIIITLVPVIYFAKACTWLEFGVAHGLGGLWVYLVYFDLATGRFVQPVWMKEHLLPFLQSLP